MMPARERHRGGPLPRRWRLIEVDDLSRVRRQAATGIDDLAVIIHDGRAVIAAAEEPRRPCRPFPGPLQGEEESLLGGSRRVKRAVRCQPGPRVPRQLLHGPGQPAKWPIAPHFGHVHIGAVLVGAGQNHHIAVAHYRGGRVPAAAGHRREGAPGISDRVEQRDIGKAETVLDVASRHEDPAIGQ